MDPSGTITADNAGSDTKGAESAAIERQAPSSESATDGKRKRMALGGGAGTNKSSSSMKYGMDGEDEDKKNTAKSYSTVHSPIPKCQVPFDAENSEEEVQQAVDDADGMWASWRAAGQVAHLLAAEYQEGLVQDTETWLAEFGQALAAEPYTIPWKAWNSNVATDSTVNVGQGPTGPVGRSSMAAVGSKDGSLGIGPTVTTTGHPAMDVNGMSVLGLLLSNPELTGKVLLQALRMAAASPSASLAHVGPCGQTIWHALALRDLQQCDMAAADWDDMLKVLDEVAEAKEAQAKAETAAEAAAAGPGRRKSIRRKSGVAATAAEAAVATVAAAAGLSSATAEDAKEKATAALLPGLALARHVSADVPDAYGRTALTFVRLRLPQELTVIAPSARAQAARLRAILMERGGATLRRTPLHAAVEECSMTSVKEALAAMGVSAAGAAAAGVNLGSTAGGGSGPGGPGAAVGKGPTVDVNARDVDGWTAFHLAVQLHCAPGTVPRASPPLYTRLLSVAPQAVNVALPTFAGLSPLLTACRNGDTEAVGLIASIPGIDCNAPVWEVEGGVRAWMDPQPAWPLIEAAKNGHVGAVRALLACGASIDVTNEYGETPLFAALEEENMDVVQLLLAHGADPRKADKSGNVPREVVPAHDPVDKEASRGSGGVDAALHVRTMHTPLSRLMGELGRSPLDRDRINAKARASLGAAGRVSIGGPGRVSIGGRASVGGLGAMGQAQAGEGVGFITPMAAGHRPASRLGMGLGGPLGMRPSIGGAGGGAAGAGASSTAGPHDMPMGPRLPSAGPAAPDLGPRVYGRAATIAGAFQGAGLTPRKTEAGLMLGLGGGVMSHTPAAVMGPGAGLGDTPRPQPAHVGPLRPSVGGSSAAAAAGNDDTVGWDKPRAFIGPGPGAGIGDTPMPHARGSVGAGRAFIPVPAPPRQALPPTFNNKASSSTTAVEPDADIFDASGAIKPLDIVNSGITTASTGASTSGSHNNATSPAGSPSDENAGVKGGKAATEGQSGPSGKAVPGVDTDKTATGSRGRRSSKVGLASR